MKPEKLDRLNRLCRTVPCATKALNVVQKARAALVRAADAGIPPVSAVSSELLKGISKQSLRSVPLRQFIGMAVSAVLEDEGYELIKTGVRIRGDIVFSTGAVFKKMSPDKDAEPDVALLERFVSILTRDEKSELRKILHRKRGRYYHA